MSDNKPLRVVLASASPRRRELLSAVVARYRVKEPNVLEEFTADPVEDALRLAREKALEVQARLGPGHVTIGADTIVFAGNRSYGKPEGADEAREMLRALRGRTHSVVTAVAVASNGNVADAEILSRVALTKLSDDEIQAYVASGRPLDKAGAYAIQDDDVPTVRKLWGCHCAVMGLPLWHVRRLLAPLGVPLKRPDTTYARCAGCPAKDDAKKRP
ncbi:MAG: Maf family protein [Dehalococcoidia bacterium]